MTAASSNILIPCLTYHRLHEGGGPAEGFLRAFSIEVTRFREHLEALHQAGYVAVPLSDYFVWQQGSQPPPRPIFLTFDDGWASNLLLAQPELRRLSMPWTLFLTADRQAAAFREGGKLDRALTDDEMAALVAEGVSIQSHGLTHRPFTELTESELCRELFESRARIEALTGQPVEWLASPYGLADRRVETAARQAGYRGLASGLTGANRLLETKLIPLRRLGVRPDWRAEELLAALSPGALARAARSGDFKRRVRLILGHRLSSRLRAALRGRTAC